MWPPPLRTGGAWGSARPLLPCHQGIPKSPCGHPLASSANLSRPPKPSGPPLQEAWLLNRERELKEEIRRGRDKEIELVIHRLEADMTLAREENERAAESR